MQKKTITLTELEKISGATDYAGLFRYVMQEIEEGRLAKYSSATNGKHPALPLKYRLCSKGAGKENIHEGELMCGLHPLIDPSYYLNLNFFDFIASQGYKNGS